jgi:sodium-dependent phosphate cotransporter
MNTIITPPTVLEEPKSPHTPLRLLALVALLFLFMVGVKGMGSGFNMLGQGFLGAFFTFTENPFVGLMIGILATTLVQSSSVSTAMLVGLVAAPDNPLPIANAVPMIMGANIGTTVTNTIVCLGHIGRKHEFQRAFAVATCHDFFNFIVVATLLPLELATGFLQHIAFWLADFLATTGGYSYQSPIKGLLKTVLGPIKDLSKWLFDSTQWQGVFIVGVSVLFIFTALVLLVKLMRSAVQSRIQVFITRFLSRNIMLSFTVGVLVTVMVQSSSITTSLMVPLAGAGILTISQAFPVTLGANLGTTITALLASLAVSGGNAKAGVVIALVHLMFNLTGTLMILPWPPMRKIPIKAAELLASIATRSRRWALIYVVFLFYVIPTLFAVIFR